METPLTDYASVKAYLYGLKHRGAFYGIDRMRSFVEELGHPERKYPVVHVAGTNGKGSTCAMIEAIFRAAGYKTGLFTSPHLIHQGERVQVNREILSHDAIVEYTKRLKPIAEEMDRKVPELHPTFFEFMTGMAFLRFAECGVDIGIIETGLGGRLDATNVVVPLVSVITSISLDHTEILGDTIEAIAREKAGIIKDARPVVLGFLPKAAEAVIRAIAAERNAEVFSARETFGEELSRYPMTSLPGDYQRRNAATATLVARVLKKYSDFHFEEKLVASALQKVRWAGRWEKHALKGKDCILDATHNPEGIIELEKNLSRLSDEIGRKPIIIAGTLGEKRGEVLIPVLVKYAQKLYLIMPKQPRSCSFETMRGFVPKGADVEIIDSSVESLFPSPGECSVGGEGDVVVVTGSIYLIGEVFDALYHEVPVNEQVLQD